MLTLGSLFDGLGTAPLAARMCGILPVWASEIEKFPIAVTKKNFPDMLHVGDITKLNGTELPPVDIICGGSPCQDLSVAGKQAGLKDGTRSNLFFEMIRVIKEMRGVLTIDIRDISFGKTSAAQGHRDSPKAATSTKSSDSSRKLPKVTYMCLNLRETETDLFGVRPAKWKVTDGR